MIKRFLACCKEGERGITTEGPASFVVSLSLSLSLSLVTLPWSAAARGKKDPPFPSFQGKRKS